jgi:hypothetical protein
MAARGRPCRRRRSQRRRGRLLATSTAAFKPVVIAGQRSRPSGAVKRGVAECSGGRGSGNLLGGRDRAVPYTMSSRQECCASVALLDDDVQRLHLRHCRGVRRWSDRLACFCVRVAATKCCCVLTATTVSGIAAGRARAGVDVSAGGRLPSATRAAGAVNSSMPRALRAGAGDDARCASNTGAATPIK